MIRKMIKIRLGDNKEGLIFDTTPVIVHMVETTRSNKVINGEWNNPRTDAIVAELSRHTNTWENISNCTICKALNAFDTKNGYASNLQPDIIGYYASDNRLLIIHNEAKWLTSIQPTDDTALVVLTRKDFYDTDGHIHQQQIDVPEIKTAFENKTAI